MSTKDPITDEAIEEVCDELTEAFENDNGVRVNDPTPRMFWDAEGDDEEVAMLEQSSKGTWYPRPTVTTMEMAAEMILRGQPDSDDRELVEFPIPKMSGGDSDDQPDTNFHL